MRWTSYYTRFNRSLAQFAFICCLGTITTLFWANRAYSQCGEYTIYTLEEKNEVYFTTRIREFNDYYYWNLFGNPQFKYPVTQNRLLKIDQDLNLIWATILKDVPGSMSGSLVFFPGDFLLKGNKALVLSDTRDSLSWQRSFLANQVDLASGHLDTTYAFDLGLDVLDIYDGIYNAILATDSSAYLYTGEYILQDTTYLVVMKADFTGAKHWVKSIPMPTPGYFYSHQPGIALPGGQYLIVVNANKVIGVDYLVRIDSTGELLEMITGPFVEEGIDLALHPNGNIVYFSKPNPYVISNKVAGMRLTMLSPDLDTLWSHTYHTFEYPYNFAYGAGEGKNISIAPDGRILMVGESGHTLHLVCYSPEGELLWTRVVHLSPEKDINGAQVLTEFGQAIWTSDGCILASGIYHGGFNDFYYRPFLLKLDSLGCLEPGCEENIILSTDQPSETLPDDCWQVYPNPFSGPIHLELDTDCPLADVVDQVVITDMLGREVYRQRFLPGTTNLEIVLPASATGMLSLRIQAGPVILGQRHLIRLE